jgi:Fe-S cluster assembly protein SufD
VVDTLPQLEILADDVKCTHGATVGQLDSEEVFYLRSRGLSEEAARDLLTYAFGAEVIKRIPVASLRGRLEDAVLERTTRRP